MSSYKLKQKGSEVQALLNIVAEGVAPKNHSHGLATENTSGFMSPEEKKALAQKIDGAYVENGYLFLTSGDEAVVGPLGPFDGGIDYISNSTPNSALNDGGRTKPKAIISFIDDDCRAEAYSILYQQVIQPLNVPYAVACPPGDIVLPEEATDNDRYMNLINLKEMYDNGVNIACHHYQQHNMDDATSYPTPEAYAADLAKCQKTFQSWGIHDVKSLCYPQGRRVNELIPIVKQYYHLGFTVGPGVNQMPYESYHMRRVGLFDSNTSDPTGAAAEESLANAKKFVDRVVNGGGWVVFMTHAWYQGFNASKLRELIAYIRGKEGVDIVSINEGLERTGNVIEVGNFRKPIDEMVEPYFVVAANGHAYANALHATSSDDNEPELTIKRTKVESDWHSGYIIGGENGNLVTHSDQNRRVSDDISVKPGEIYQVTCSAIYAANAYAVLDKTSGGTMKDNYRVENTQQGEILTDYEITIPEGGAILRVASNITIQPEGFAIYKIEYVDPTAMAVDATLSLSGQPADAKTTGELLNKVVNAMGSYIVDIDALIGGDSVATTADDIRMKLEGLIGAASEKTGVPYSNLTTAMSDLIDGYLKE